MHGLPVGKEMGINTWAAFAGTDEAAVVDGDFAMLESELQPVLRAMRKEGINIVAIHQHMSHEQPRYLFLHYWGKGKAVDLAQSLKRVLDAQAAVNHEEARPCRDDRSRTTCWGLPWRHGLSAETAIFEADPVGGPPRGWLLTMTGKGAPKWTVERDEGDGAVLK